MKVIKKETVSQVMATLVDIECDRCGISCKVDGVLEFATLAADWQTPFPGWEATYHELHICKECWHLHVIPAALQGPPEEVCDHTRFLPGNQSTILLQEELKATQVSLDDNDHEHDPTR